METAVHPAKTLMEVFKSLPEGTLVQLIENELLMLPASKGIHQKVLIRLIAALYNLIEQNKLGEVRCAPYDVYLDNSNAYQPDIIFIANDNVDTIKEDGIYGAPDLIIEILLAGTARYDKNKKKEVYERTGVKEYWIVDPADKSALGYSLKNGKFIELERAKGIIHSKLLNASLSF